MPTIRKSPATTANKKKNDYELVLILRPQKNNEALSIFIEKIKTIINHLGIQILKQNIQDNKLLAYPIQKQTSGIYIFFNFKSYPQKVERLKNKLNQNNQILRSLIIKQNIKVQKIRPKTIKSIKEKSRISQGAKGPKKKIKVPKEPKISIQELDKKLDKILEGEI